MGTDFGAKGDGMGGDVFTLGADAIEKEREERERRSTCSLSGHGEIRIDFRRPSVRREGGREQLGGSRVRENLEIRAKKATNWANTIKR